MAITATADGKSGSAQITVTRPPVASVTVSPASLTMTVGDQGQLSVAVRDAAGHVLTDRAVSWQSSRGDIVEVRQDGSVVAHAPGHADITATSEGVSGSASVDVRLAPVASVTISPSFLNLNEGQSGTLHANVRDANGNAITGRAVQWQSSNASAVSISGSGQDVSVTGLQGGSGATVTATVDGVSGSATVTVNAPSLPPDPYEPNDFASQASNLGNLNDGSVGVVTTATIHSLTDEDWYRVHAVEASGSACFPGTSQSFLFQVDLSFIPVGRDYDLEVHLGSPTGEVRLSQNSGNANEHVSFTLSGVCGNADAFDFWVHVKRYSGDPSDQPYRLQLQFDRN